MQCLYLLLLVAACQGLAVQKLAKEPLARPEILKLVAQDPPSVQVEWKPVKSADEKNPVLGYKIIVWELKPITTFKYVDVDGVRTLVEDLRPQKITEAETPPEKEAREIVVPGPLASQGLVPDLKLNVIHEIRVRAFTKNHDGPLSGMMRIELQDRENTKNRDNDLYKFV